MQENGFNVDCAVLRVTTDVSFQPNPCYLPRREYDIPKGFICMKPNPRKQREEKVFASSASFTPVTTSLPLPTKPCRDGSRVLPFHSCAWLSVGRQIWLG